MEADPAPGKRPAPFDATPVPPPKKAMIQAQSAQPSTAHASMSEKMLQRQNAALASAKANLQRELNDTAAQLKIASTRLQRREECISLLDRHWALLEARLHSVTSQLSASPGGTADDVGAAVSHKTLLQALHASEPAEPAELDSVLRRRCEATVTLAEAATRVLLAVATSPGDETARTLSQKLAMLESEKSRLASELDLARDRAVAVARERDDAASRLSRSQGELEKMTRDLQKSKNEVLHLKGDGAGTMSAAAVATAIDAAGGAPSHGSVGADVATVPNAEVNKLRADAEAAKEERSALEKVAEDAKTELKAAHAELSMLRIQVEELAHRPPREEQIMRTAKWMSMQREVDQNRQAVHVIERLRSDMAALQQRHGAEIVHGDEVRARQFEEAQLETERLSKQLAQAASERDAYQQKLSELTMLQRSVEERLAESDRVLALWRTEAERVKKDVHRERSRLLDLEAERDTARREKEVLRQQADALRLRCESRAQPPAGDAVATAEAKCQDALVRLGGAEMAALQAKEDLLKLRVENDALVEELDSIAKAFEESQEHNAKLLKMIEMKEEAATRLMQERMRADRSTVLIQQEQAAQAERVAAADRVAEKEADLRAGLEAQMKAAREAHAKLEEAQRHAVGMLDHARRAAEAAQREALQAKEELKLEQDKVQRSSGREAKAAAAAAEANAKVKSLTQEREAVERKLKRLERSAGPASSADGGKNSDYYRAMCKCPVCHSANKDTVITKCGHAFCRGCLDKRLELRNRKCPGCSQVFDKSYVRELWLEHGA